MSEVRTVVDSGTTAAGPGVKHPAGWVCPLLAILVALNAGCGSRSEVPRRAFRTESPGTDPPAPHEMPDLFNLPDGFSVTLFAGEPDVQQPIAFDFDDRGRIWVAENFTYGERGNPDPLYRDRIIILHDTDGDGKHDVRKIFWDQGNMLTGLTWGFGGLWILNDGTLSFIPDGEGDDVPDSEPVEMLNGWTKAARHNFVNGLLWGPDGWLYGRHGQFESSLPGTPDTPVEHRQPMNSGIWRFHPVTHDFEIVCHGTVNPWGLDYDKHGEMFMTNNINGHLWHVIPGAHYERVSGQDLNPHLYELMAPCSDHKHYFETGGRNENGHGKTDDFGGGHSHCGGMIYYGDNFPDEYRGKMFMCNTHGRCVNLDRLEPQGSTYIGKHDSNFLTVDTRWFRGVSLKYGPTGCVYLSDWSDLGECHDLDGVHRSSGRIYRIAWGDRIQPVSELSLFHDREMSNADLLAAALPGRNEWARRRAMRLLLERAAAGEFHPNELLTWEPYQTGFESDEQEFTSANTAWLMLAISHVLPEPFDAETIRRLLASRHEHTRGIAIRLLVANADLLTQLGHTLADMSRRDSSPHVRMCLASSLQKLPFDCPTSLGAEIAAGLTVQSADSVGALPDPQHRRMIWYGIEPNYLHFKHYSRMTDATLLHHYVRRWASDWNQTRVEMSDELLKRSQQSRLASANEQDVQIRQTASFLNATLQGLRGQIHPAAPDNWKLTAANLHQFNDPEINQVVAELSAIFGDGAAMADLRAIVANRAGDHTIRRNAISALAATRDVEAISVLLEVLDDRSVCMDVVKALANFDDQRISANLLDYWPNFRDGNRDHVIDTMISRKSYAMEFVQGITAGHVDSADLTASQVRQLLAFNEPEIASVIESRWGMINDSSEARNADIARWKNALTSEELLNANPDAGEVLYRKTCGACHKLYGDGGSIGPDLTGSDRGNLDYVLGNIIDPSSVVPRQFVVTTIGLRSGRQINGVVIAETSSTITVQTGKEQIVIDPAEIDERVLSGKSLMPEGLLETLSHDQVCDLIAFVMQRR